MCQTKIRAFPYIKKIAQENTFFYKNGHKSSKKGRIDFSNFQAYLLDQTLNLAPLLFLYP
jgi:hypothetical protein